MGKNVIVLDEFGNQIGLTYPKRARGLVKSGRAEYADSTETEIRLLSAHAPTEKTEELTMSNVINFNAREFRFDTSCNDNAGSRMFITDNFGENVEIFEIGDWCWAWTQICSEKKLEKNADYVFRFAMTGGCNDTCDGTSQFVIIPIEGEELTLEDWENRYVYNLSQSQYKPALSKRSGNGMIRVYEIPFNTCGCEKFRFVFISQHVVTRLFPAHELNAYSDMEDLTYEQWWAERTEQLAAENEQNSGNIDLSGAVLSEKALNKIMEKVQAGKSIDLSGAVIGNP